MKKKLMRLCFRLTILMMVGASVLLVSCKDDYLLDEQEPDWLGASIYDYLVNDGSYTTYVRLIKDAEYEDVLAKTGSKTLFVANDSAFQRFFNNNKWGIHSYEELSDGQKRMILFFGMIDNAYLIETLSNYNYGGVLHEGTAIRRETSVSILDSIPFEQGDALPNGTYWEPYKQNGIYLLKDDSRVCLIHLLQKALDYLTITDEDFELITGLTRSWNDAHIFGNKVIERDITCKNGYINVLEDVLTPPSNMASYIQENENSKTFANMLGRFCAPYYDSENTRKYKELHPEFNDSIYVKHFFASRGGRIVYPDNQPVSSNVRLSYDPGWNSYQSVESNSLIAVQADMGAMFVPTDDAMDYYFNQGKGRILKERYKTWENVPDNVIIKLIQRHMRSSFITSVPSRFNLLVDENNSRIPVDKSHIVSSYIGTNGIVYFTSEVYPPDDYVSVYAPVLMSNKTRVMREAVEDNDFALYINSLESNYSFFVPTDEFFKNYIDPFTYGLNKQGALKFWYDASPDLEIVKATIYQYDAVNDVIGDSVGIVTDQGFINNRLVEILDAHIIVGNVEDGKKYYLSKGGSLVKAEGAGENLRVQGSSDIGMNKYCNVVDSGFYAQTNGNTYFIDKPIQPTEKSVYKVLSDSAEFSEFFDLLYGFAKSDTFSIFTIPAKERGIDENVKFLNAYNYTIYVPSNEAINNAILNGDIPSWKSRGSVVGIDDMTDINEQRAAIRKLSRILRYHFQDNSVLISGLPVSKRYQTATIKTDDSQSFFNTYKNKSYKIEVNGSGDGLQLITEDGKTANVITNNGLYNILTRDYRFNKNPKDTKDIDGTGSGTNTYSSSQIVTSSIAVIHQIDKVLNFE
ncbi:MAG: fasciclin domain-containing protein [Marinilabiliaceae bacterium]|nr:fasciclin domain-containing protein [Marinilabiliaceae bacterium]